jgi:SAM-dependent methyltransferase
VNRADLYDWELAHVANRADEDVHFYTDLATGPTLELACGTGRLTRHLTDVAPLVVGVDLDAAMLAAARGKVGGLALLMQADMRAFSFAGRPFDLVAIPYNSLQLLTSVDDQVACLANVAAVLRKPRGRLALEVSTFAAESPVGDEPLAAADGVELWGSLDVDGPLVRYRKRFRSGDQDVHEEEIVLRDYADGEFDEVLAAGGFAIESARSFRRGRLVNAAPIG